MRLTKQEIRDIKKHEEDFDLANLLPEEKARGQIMKYLIAICHGRRGLHDSGYPFIKIIGVHLKKDKQKRKYYDLGWHDHYVVYCSSNTDCLGKNIFRVMPWASKEDGWLVSEYYFSTSSLMIGNRSKEDSVSKIT